MAKCTALTGSAVKGLITAEEKVSRTVMVYRQSYDHYSSTAVVCRLLFLLINACWYFGKRWWLVTMFSWWLSLSYNSNHRCLHWHLNKWYCAAIVRLIQLDRNSSFSAFADGTVLWLCVFTCLLFCPFACMLHVLCLCLDVLIMLSYWRRK